MKVATLGNGAGMEIIDADFGPLGRIALKAIFRIPVPIREAVLFGRSRFCLPLQKLFVRALGGAYLVQTRFTEGPMCGQRFACLTSEKYFLLGSHIESDVQRVFSVSVKPGDTVYDIGGHAGYTSLLFSALVGPGGRVFTFEPSPANYERLCANMDANQKQNVTIIKAAVSSHTGVAVLKECGCMSALVSGADEVSRATSEVKTITIDDFVSRRRNPAPDFVKLDVEGHAGPVLEGMASVLNSKRPAIICELHDPAEDEHVKRILAEARYRVSPIYTHRQFPRHALAAPQ